MRILLAQINPTIADLNGNTKKILSAITYAKSYGADLVLFPELALTGYPPDDFLLLPNFLTATHSFLEEIQRAALGITVVVGTPRIESKKQRQRLYNSAAIFSNGELIGFQDKSLLPTYDVFDELRYFDPAPETKVWQLCGKKIAVTICEDLWQHSGILRSTGYLRDPVMELKGQSPDLLLNLSASPYSQSKIENRSTVCAQAAVSLNCPVLLCNQVGANDSLIFDGHSLYVGSDGTLLGRAKGFVEEYFLVDLDHPKKNRYESRKEKIEELYEALVLGVRDYFHKSGFFTACLGISGGIDSAVVAAIAVEALGHQNVLGIMMPTLYTSKESITDALALSRALDIPYKEIPIHPTFQHYLDLLAPHFSGKEDDVTEENLQARIRAIMLMALSNKWGYLLLNTANKSELAMGYSTLYGDMCGGLSVIGDLYKNDVYSLAQWINREKKIIPTNTIKRPPSAELKQHQKDSDTLPDYEIVDRVVKAYIEEQVSPEEIAQRYHYPLGLVQQLIHRIHLNEYKRRQAPLCLRVTEKAFSVGRRFPIVQKWT